MDSSTEADPNRGSAWRILGTLRDREITKTGRGVDQLFAALEQTFGLGPAWVTQVQPDVLSPEGDLPPTIELVWHFGPEEIWLTPALAELFQEPVQEGFEDDFRVVITLRCE